MKEFYVYITTNPDRTVLYTGVTNDLEKRVNEHKSGSGSQFTAKYKICRLVYFEEYQSINDAIAREKQIKDGSRKKKITLIESKNPNWLDLSE